MAYQGTLLFLSSQSSKPIHCWNVNDIDIEMYNTYIDAVNDFGLSVGLTT